jgi:hypothetical protein
MKRFIFILLIPVLLMMALCAPVSAGYSIYTAPLIPEFVQVNGPYGPERIPNAELPIYPASYGREICRPENYSPFVIDQARRRRVFADSNGIASSAELFAVCPQIRKIKEAEIRAAGAARLIMLASPYSAAERETWAQQQAEALEHQTNPDCECAMIRNMATTRQIPLDLMAAKILENAALFKTYSGQILGVQQHLLDLIESEPDFATLLSISWP